MQQITVCTPYEPERKLALAYNRAMEQASTEWVLFLDWDLFNCNPYWYDMCQLAVKKVGHEAGWITCMTNRIGAPQQKYDDAPTSNDVLEHMDYAKNVFKRHSVLTPDGRLLDTAVIRIPGALSGFFILTSKTAWRKCGGFDENRKRLVGVDNIYSRDVSRAGFRLFCIPGLYFYHVYHEKTKVWRGGHAGAGTMQQERGHDGTGN